jgi:hypothetical protein
MLVPLVDTQPVLQRFVLCVRADQTESAVVQCILRLLELRLHQYAL